MNPIICDTNIFINAFNGNQQTIAALAEIGTGNTMMPSITAMELLRGMRNREELDRMVKRIKAFNILHFNENVSRRSVELIKLFKLSHDLQIPDGIIAALAVEYDLPIFTYNVKDFRFNPGLQLYQHAT
jgi:predicted nucleic acid-binding protein